MSDAETLIAKIEEVVRLAAVLVADMAEAVPDLACQRHRRSYVRAAFAFVEGTLFGLKGILLGFSAHFGTPLEPGETELLEENSYGLKEDGSVRVSPALLRLPDNVRFAFALAAKVSGAPTTVRYDDDGWASFKESIRVRNRLVHPKAPADLVVTDLEMARLDKATAWYRDSAIDIMVKIKASVIARGA